MEEPPSLFLALFLMSEQWILLLNLIPLFVLIFLSGFVSGSENAFFSLAPKDIDEMKESQTGDLVFSLLSDKKTLLATILIANNFINIAIVLLSDYTINTYIASIGETLDESTILFIKVFGITTIILLFGEIIPKVYSNSHAKEMAIRAARPIMFLETMLSPFVSMLRRTSDWFEKKIHQNESNLSVDQLSHALEITTDNETMEDRKILQGIITFGNTDSKQIMTPRVDMITLSYDEPFNKVIQFITSENYSRIPVYKENTDNIVGILYIKDVLAYMDRKEFEWQTLLKKPLFVPENKKLDDILSSFQEQKVHLAIVVDEYGGTSGLVTLEDIIEEIVGDISDEFDEDNVSYSKIDNENYIFDGKTSLKDFYRIIDLDDASQFEDEKGDSESLAGFVQEISNGKGKKGEPIEWNGYCFVIELMDKKSIKRVKVTLKKDEESE